MDKFPQEDGYYLQQRQQQRSPRFPARSRQENLGMVMFDFGINFCLLFRLKRKKNDKTPENVSVE